MKPSTRLTNRRFSLHRNLPVLLFFISLTIALLSGILLFNPAVIGSLSSTIINTGIDQSRAQLIAVLIMTAATALAGAFIGRSKLGALLGAWIVFLFGYLFGFIQLATHPTYDPGGYLEPLVVGALVHTSILMNALALLSAFIGAAVGVALSFVLLDPLYRLARSLWYRYSHTQEDTGQVYVTTTRQSQRTVFTIIGSWFAAVAMIALLVLASGSTELFIYYPEIGLHTSPNLPNPTKTIGGETIPSHGTVVTDSLVSPTLGGQKRKISVYLPPTYYTRAGQTKRYPALYLLHGSPGQAHDWFTAGKANQSADTLISLGKIPESIQVLPDGNGRPGATSEWGNSYDQRQLIESYVVNDVVKYVDSKYRTIADVAHRAIGGLSMGAFGATNIAVHHPDVFGFVISLGGYYYADAKSSIWGNNAAYMRLNSPAVVLPTNKQAWKLQFFLGSGTKDQPYYTDAQQFAQELDSLHIAYHHDVQQGYHSWIIWQTQMYSALVWLRWGR